MPYFLFIPLLSYPFVHNVQIGICKQRANQSTLRRPFLVDLAFIHDPGLQHCLDDLQNTPVMDSHVVQALQQDAVVDMVKAFADVTLDNLVISCVVHDDVDALQGHCRIPHGPESVGVSIELRFQNRSSTIRMHS